MKFSALLLIQFVLLWAANVGAQDLTVILFRHAEKEAATKFDNNDPDLTTAGKARAEKLLTELTRYRPTQIFSTNRTRTRATVLPSALKLDDQYRIQIQIYDGTNLAVFADRILALRFGTIAVSGHSDTTPQLANLLLKEEKYKPFADDEYNKIIIVKIRGKKVSSSMIEY